MSIFESLKEAVRNKDMVYTAYLTPSGTFGPDPQIFQFVWSMKELIGRSFAIDYNSDGDLMILMLDEFYNPVTDQFVRTEFNHTESKKYLHFIRGFQQ